MALHNSDINKRTNIITPRSISVSIFHGSIKFSPHRGANLSTPDKHKDSLSPQISSLQIALPAALQIQGEITPNIWKCSLYLKSVIKEMRCVRKCKVWGVTESSVSLCFDNYAAKRVPEKRQLNCGREGCGGCWFWGPTKEKKWQSAHTHSHTQSLTHAYAQNVWLNSNLPDT